MEFSIFSCCIYSWKPGCIFFVTLNSMIQSRVARLAKPMLLSVATLWWCPSICFSIFFWSTFIPWPHLIIVTQTLKFKSLYLLNCNNCFSKICSICCVVWILVYKVRNFGLIASCQLEQAEGPPVPSVIGASVVFGGLQLSGAGTAANCRHTEVFLGVGFMLVHPVVFRCLRLLWLTALYSEAVY